MPATFPTTVIQRVPTSRTLTVPADVVEFLDGSEQRWRSGLPLNAITLAFQDVSGADLTAMRNFIDTVKGAFDSTWSITWGADGNSYPAMALNQDDLPMVAQKSNRRWTGQIKMRQVASSGSYGATASPVFPALPNGCITQRPFTQNGRYLTTRNDLPSGPRYSYFEWPTAHGLWVVSYPVITVSELTGLLNFFIAMGGRYTMFSFTDPITTVAHPHCRFDQDTFECKYMGGLQWATTLQLAEFFHP